MRTELQARQEKIEQTLKLPVELQLLALATLQSKIDSKNENPALRQHYIDVKNGILAKANYKF